MIPSTHQPPVAAPIPTGEALPRSPASGDTRVGREPPRNPPANG
ncbi:hypothetical protein [Halobaculum sp. EA56]